MWRRTDEETPNLESRPAPPAPQPAQAPRRTGQVSVLGRSLKLEGRLGGEEDLVVEGRVSGEIDIPGHQVTIGPEGRVEAEIRATAIVVEGEVHGNLSAEEQVVVRASGKVHGDIRAPRVALDQGCRFKGTVDMEPMRKDKGNRELASSPPEPLPRPADGGSSPPGKPPAQAIAAKTSSGGPS
jgi:cytoskeletal protein CcmA (bactofilin family)